VRFDLGFGNTFDNIDFSMTSREVQVNPYYAFANGTSLGAFHTYQDSDSFGTDRVAFAGVNGTCSSPQGVMAEV
jgi:hypothetical protein